MRERFVESMDEIDPTQWNALDPTGNPFLRHEFLAALEHARCVGKGTGWQPYHAVVLDAHGIAAAAPAYLKTHSYGEFVFDFAWAQAHVRAGLEYYPKLTIAVPFTPATGPRLLTRPDIDRRVMAAKLAGLLQTKIERSHLSSAHVLFVDDEDREILDEAGWLLRRDCQFHWKNRGYSSFDEYLQTFTAEKRKKVRRERRRVAEMGISFETRLGPELDEPTLDRVYALKRDTFLRHGHEPYLSREFFGEVAQTLGDSLMVKLAMLRGRIVATAIFFWNHGALYGRYWGAAADFHSLHFEACYHQGIEFCIERGIRTFEPGTQGEHKVSRGFEPALTWSAHWIAEPRFRRAIGDFLLREGEAVDAYAADVDAHVPYRAP